MLEWNRTISAFEEADIISEADLWTLACYCREVEAAYTAEEAVRQQVEKGQADYDGSVCFTDKGSLKPNPTYVQARNARRIAMQYACEFGLTPAARAKLAPGANASTGVRARASAAAAANERPHAPQFRS